MKNIIVFNPKKYYDKFYLEFKDYIINNSIYKPIVSKTIPKDMAKFPTIIFTNDTSNPIQNKTTLNLVEYFTYMSFSITIYTANKGSIVKEISSDELSYWVRNYLMNLGLLITNESDITSVDNKILTKIFNFECKIKNTNEQMYKI